MIEVCPKEKEKAKEPARPDSPESPDTMTATVSMTLDPSDPLPTTEEHEQSSQKSEQDKDAVAVTIIASTATVPISPAPSGTCFSHEPYAAGCQKAPGFPGQCVCNALKLPEPVQPASHSAEKYGVEDSMAVSAGSDSAKLMYQVPYLVEEDRQFWVHEPHGDYVMRSVKGIAELECAGHWANTCTGQPYYQCDPKKIRYDPKDFNEAIAKSGLSHLEFHKRYQPA
ncbi:hypothetical protein BBP40_000947 [Aspergillus hancockii]|nr:hypothetical protein BBP40_000947 [Aspergillus hancockii]